MRSREVLCLRLMGPQSPASLFLQLPPFCHCGMDRRPRELPGTWLEPAPIPNHSQKQPHGLIHPRPLSTLADSWPCWANILTGGREFYPSVGNTFSPKRTTSSKPHCGWSRLPPSGLWWHCIASGQREVAWRVCLLSCEKKSGHEQEEWAAGLGVPSPSPERVRTPRAPLLGHLPTVHYSLLSTVHIFITRILWDWQMRKQV